MTHLSLLFHLFSVIWAQYNACSQEPLFWHNFSVTLQLILIFNTIDLLTFTSFLKTYNYLRLLKIFNR